MGFFEDLDYKLRPNAPTMDAPSEGATVQYPAYSLPPQTYAQSYTMPLTSFQAPVQYSAQTVQIPIAPVPVHFPQTVRMARPSPIVSYQQPVVYQQPVPVVVQQPVIEKVLVKYVDKHVMAPAPPPRVEHHTEVRVVHHPWRGGGGGGYQHGNYGYGVADYGSEWGVGQYDEYARYGYMHYAGGAAPRPAYGGAAYRGYAGEYGYGGGGLPYGGYSRGGSGMPRTNLASRFAQSVPTYQTNDESFRTD